MDNTSIRNFLVFLMGWSIAACSAYAFQEKGCERATYCKYVCARYHNHDKDAFLRCDKRCNARDPHFCRDVCLAHHRKGTKKFRYCRRRCEVEAPLFFKEYTSTLEQPVPIFIEEPFPARHSFMGEGARGAEHAHGRRSHHKRH